LIFLIIINMKGIKHLLLIILLLAGLGLSCERDEIDKEKPTIDISHQDAFPVNCDTLYFGESFLFKALFSDNQALGSYSIDIHNNFNHHSHSTEVTECNLNPKKNPVNPLNLIEEYKIPEGLKEYETMQTVTIPSGNNSGLYDEGDYHLYISLTDKEGWSVQKGLSIKILYR
jgi:hypothetical protein